MTARPRQIVAMGGGGFATEPADRLDDFILGVTGQARPRMLFLPTATANVPTYLASFYTAFSRRAEASHLDLFTRTSEDIGGSSWIRTSSTSAAATRPISWRSGACTGWTRSCGRRGRRASSWRA